MPVGAAVEVFNTTYLLYMSTRLFLLAREAIAQMKAEKLRYSAIKPIIRENYQEIEGLAVRGLRVNCREKGHWASI